ncbi:glycosyltransferase family 4 protein [Candidatus Cyanaurora vandensis]|uniref:glycosyltransferase family 4 protein n=1 Tax=Candidatus Cyanaurora vandensis TaxID=2714958 RepID=UPI00257F21CF|nr:glycosyltransferase family 4 protein [Candidatus Cyanaurora vandensis]
MHIAWLGKKAPFCGNVTYSREITNSLIALGHRVSFLHFAQEDESEAELTLPYFYRSQAYTLPSLSARKRLSDSLRELRPDVVHASLTLSTLDFALPEICQELGLPLVATFHPAFDRRRRNIAANTQYLMYQLYAPFLALYDRVIVFSELQRNLLARLNVPRTRTLVIPNGVDTEKYSPGPSEIKKKLRAEHLFVYMGRLAPEKNVEALLKAWQQLDFGPHTKLAILGDGPLRPALQGLYPSAEGVVWLGFVPTEEERIEILRGADVFVLPSQVEGLSLALLESMACGVACVATDVGADGEVLKGVGILLEPQNVSTQLRTVLPMLVDLPEIRAMLGQKARQRVLQDYTLKDNIAALVRLYEQVAPTLVQSR